MVLAAGLFIALGVLDLDKTVTSLLAGAGWTWRWARSGWRWRDDSPEDD